MAYFIECKLGVSTQYHIVHVDADGKESRLHISCIRVGQSFDSSVAYIFGYHGSFYIYANSELVKLQFDPHDQLCRANDDSEILVCYISTYVYICGKYVAIGGNHYTDQPIVLDMDSKSVTDDSCDHILNGENDSVVVDGDIKYIYSWDGVEARDKNDSRLWEWKVEIGDIMKAEMVNSYIHVISTGGDDDALYLAYVDLRTLDVYHLRICESHRYLYKITCQ